MPTVREFIKLSYRLINPSNPTQPLHGDDESLAIYLLNQLLQSYASTGLMLTIAKTVSIPVITGEGDIFCGSPDFVPTPQITEGRLANVNSAWLSLTGVSYPLIPVSRDEFLASFKYEPLRGLPRLLIVYPDTEVVRLQIYPAPSQEFQFNLRGKFQLASLTSNDSMDSLPLYYMRYLQFALARDVALYKGRAEAWTEKLEQQLIEANDLMVSASEVNLSIVGDRVSLLNGAWRVRSGV